ncbi:efflux RND transporter periplasmic adaptor subunit [Niveispirillum sp. SYP-B3756]|uniref:efflux RND transporter periplasmic adaptor subunit n=1 Tax=Niveispirillum sp. SYP-B3756 TaxID=2662178 RepID=UPI0012926CD6|nr:efflux RND transporter periplasmic adaptor subunit [Niveispirillum sp. SYP-B3756]MQP64104.1 efflux RND transporter periplasmic adaptor subunit [Niveispirillum sp. SYP-B3756]
MRLHLQIATAIALVALGGGIWYVTGSGRTEGTSQVAARPVDVVATRVGRGEIKVVFDAVGTLRANEAVTVTAKTAGLVRTIRFQEGQKLSAGDVLLELDDTEVRANLAVAEATRRNAAQLLERSKALLPRQAIAQAKVDELNLQLQGAEASVRAAQARLQDLTIRAPFSGVTGLRQVSPGALVQPGTPVTTLDDTSVMKLEFTVPEVALPQLRLGMEIAASSNVYPGQAFQGTLSAVDTRIDSVTRTLAALARLPNTDGHLHPGMFMTVRLTLENRANVVLVPEEALVPVGDRQFVYLVVDGKVQRQEITIGARSGGNVEAAQGLQGGELIITRGTQKVREGLPVNAKISGGSDVPQAAARPS